MSTNRWIGEATEVVSPHHLIITLPIRMHVVEDPSCPSSRPARVPMELDHVCRNNYPKKRHELTFPGIMEDK